MRYGFYLPTRGPTSDADSLVKIVEQAERLGFDSTVIADHVVFPVQIESSYPYTVGGNFPGGWDCLLYTSPSPRDRQKSRMPSSA